MKRIILAGAALFAFAAVSPALAADTNANGNNGNGNTGAAVNGASATGTAAVTIYTPVTVTQTQGLDFGAITSGANGTVAIDAGSGARNVAGGVGAVAANVGKQGTFAVSGQSNAAINVVVGSTITGFSGGITGATKTSPLPTALSNGSAAFSVGGTLTVPANTEAGAYAGTYTVAVNYP